ncbi:unnamed protein product [Urochloa humidicola]
MAPPKKFVARAAGTLPGFGFGKGRKLQLVGDVRPAKTGVYNSFDLLKDREEEAAPAAANLAVEEAVVAAPVAGPAAAVDAAPAVAPAAVADAPRWSDNPWPWVVIAALACALVFFALLP